MNIPIRFKRTVTVLILLLFILPAAAVSGEELQNQCDITIQTAENKEVSLHIELAKTSAERAYGLMNRDKLGENSGMLFVYNREEYLSHWMKNVTIPLSIAFIDQSGIIKDIQKMKPLDASVSYLSRFPAKYALEVNQGWFEKNRVKVGDKVLLNGCIGL